METVRNIVFKKNVHINADIENAQPDYFNNPKYKTPEDVLQKKMKTCMANYCCTIERFLQEGCIKHLVDNRGFDICNIFTCQDGLMNVKDFGMMTF